MLLSIIMIFFSLFDLASDFLRWIFAYVVHWKSFLLFSGIVVPELFGGSQTVSRTARFLHNMICFLNQMRCFLFDLMIFLIASFSLPFQNFPVECPAFYCLICHFVTLQFDKGMILLVVPHTFFFFFCNFLPFSFYFGGIKVKDIVYLPFCINT